MVGLKGEKCMIVVIVGDKEGVIERLIRSIAKRLVLRLSCRYVL